MGLFRRLFRPSPGTQEWISASAKGDHAILDSSLPTILEGRTTLEVVGESFHQAELWRMVGKSSPSLEYVREEIQAVLAAEPDNEHDPDAVSVWISGRQVGHLSRSDAARYRAGLLALQQRIGGPIALRGVIVGGGLREDGPGRLGVFLQHDPADFGVARPRPAGQTSRMDTGLSDAILTDAADDTYDLRWVQTLPSDPIQAIPILRQRLQDTRDPIDRHFVFHHLETALYKSHKQFPSNLIEYDECCQQHDAEIETIRESFIAKWGTIPRLHTYKQMCIRLAKQKDFARALRWAERGLAIYGKNAARPEAVDDLSKRAESYRAKIG